MATNLDIFTTLARLSYDSLKNNLQTFTTERPNFPLLIRENASEFPHFTKNLSAPKFLESLANNVYAHDLLRGVYEIGAAKDTAKLLWHIHKYDLSVKKRESEKAKVDIMSQLELYSEIVHKDNNLLSALNIINWLEDIYQTPEKPFKSIIDLKNTFMRNREFSLDLDSISTSSNVEMYPYDRENIKKVMISAYHFLRKGLIIDAENSLESTTLVFF